ncbi:MAG: Unknown protein [uncultured Sulfurovum sp.]|uniref:Uncharacterized protein n=1 Tax=uncultured Sulfurovum sp. TaxID=269237 RepID=A0A6S6TIE5_9BACT|nr:MAG: Unknown protein [uncultured Sulfurovum sp.]
MIAILTSKSTVNFLKSIFIAIILALTIAPIILVMTSANASWVFMATLLWAMGSILIFHPFIQYVYPHLMSKVSVYLLTSILIIVSAWLNITMITLLLPYDYIYYSLFNATLTQIALWGSVYIIFINAIITNFVLINNIDFYKEERLF